MFIHSKSNNNLSLLKLGRSSSRTLEGNKTSNLSRATELICGRVVFLDVGKNMTRGGEEGDGRG